LRHRYLVAYDIAHPRRLRAIFKKMNGFGEPMQYSVFRCDLSAAERTRMVEAVLEIINTKEDRVMIVNLGPCEGRARRAFRFLGRRDKVPEEPGPLVF
jgi:CRISPR-associated protein Cas2